MLAIFNIKNDACHQRGRFTTVGKPSSPLSTILATTVTLRLLLYPYCSNNPGARALFPSIEVWLAGWLWKTELFQSGFHSIMRFEMSHNNTHVTCTTDSQRRIVQFKMNKHSPLLISVTLSAVFRINVHKNQTGKLQWISQCYTEHYKEEKKVTFCRVVAVVTGPEDWRIYRSPSYYSMACQVGASRWWRWSSARRLRHSENSELMEMLSTWYDR